MNRTNPNMPRRLAARHLIAAAVAACFAGGANALPAGPAVVNGSAAFSQTGNALTVTNSNGAIIQWQTFGIGAGETARFVQPSASSSVLNQVVTNNPSALYGTLSSNGKVWLVNPAGILIGPGALIDTAGFVGSTLNVRAEDFLAGRLTFQPTPGAGSVINQGTITTPAGGSVYLVGPSVTNEGIITTPGGETLLAAGQTVALIDTATPGVQVEITGTTGSATNLGSIIAQAGRIGIAGPLVRNSGTLDASSVVQEGGRIFLKASQDAYVDGASRISATGTRGGSVEVLGDRVAVTDRAEIDASGTVGGGRVLVGGDFQGSNPDVANSRTAYFGPDATIRVNGGKTGSGGTAIVWADDTTRAYGTIEARGGASGGDGGLVETSGHRFLDVNGIRVDTRAPQGTSGTWLLDPDTITVVPSGADSGGSFSSGVFSSGGSDATLTWTTIDSNLASGNVRLQTGTSGAGDITFTAGTYTSANRNMLSLFAYGNGSATGNISFSGANLTLAGGLEIVGGWNGTPGSFGTVTGHGDVTMTNSQIVADGAISIYGGNMTLTGVRSNQQNVTLTATGDVLLQSSFTGYFDDYSFVYNLPFAFTYFGNRYTQAYITTNALIAFPTSGSFTANGGPYQYSDSVAGMSQLRDAVSGAPLAVIAPAWNDWILRASTGKDVLIRQISPNTLAVQFVVARFADESNTANFEALLNRNGNIQFDYGTATRSYAGDVTIGLSNGTTSFPSQLMSLPNFSLNLLQSTTFTPSGSTYTETVSASSTPLANMTGAVSGGRLLESLYGGSFGTNGIFAPLGNVGINAGGPITGYTGVQALQLSTVSSGGTTLAGTQVGRFSGTNSGSGDILLSNGQPITLGVIGNSAGNISVDNIGGVTVGSNISASGSVTLAAQSPLTINNGATITAGGDIVLIASGTSTTTDLLTIAGGASSTSGNIRLDGGGGVDIAGTANLSAPVGSIQANSSAGSVFVDPLATINTPSFLVGGVLTPTTPSVTTSSPVVSQVVNTIVTSSTTTPAAQPAQEAQLVTFVMPTLDSPLLMLEQSIFHTIGGGVDEFGSQERIESFAPAVGREGEPGAAGKKSVAQCKG